MNINVGYIDSHMIWSAYSLQCFLKFMKLGLLLIPSHWWTTNLTRFVLNAVCTNSWYVRPMLCGCGGFVNSDTWRNSRKGSISRRIFYLLEETILTTKSWVLRLLWWGILNEKNRFDRMCPIWCLQIAGLLIERHHTEWAQNLEAMKESNEPHGISMAWAIGIKEVFL